MGKYSKTLLHIKLCKARTVRGIKVLQYLSQQIVREKRSRFSFSSNVDVDIDGVVVVKTSANGAGGGGVGDKDLLLLFESLPANDDSNLDTRL